MVKIYLYLNQLLTINTKGFKILWTSAHFRSSRIRSWT